MTATMIRCSLPPAVDGEFSRPHAVIRSAIGIQQIHGKRGWIEVVSSVCRRICSRSLRVMVHAIGSAYPWSHPPHERHARIGRLGLFQKKWIQDTIII
jgi:hypothetical protein